MKEDFPTPPSAKEMRADIYERESAARREKEDGILAQFDRLDEEFLANPSTDQAGERALLNATLRQLQEEQKKAESMYESGR